MQKEKGAIGVIIAAVIVIAAVLGTGGYFMYKYIGRQIYSEQNNQNIVGGDRDEHGCIGSAGYSWCEAKQKCLRVWEEPCSQILSDVYPLFSGVSWGDAAPRKIGDLDGYEIKAEGEIGNNQDSRVFFNYYDNKLKEAGWSADGDFSTDGVLGSMVGYKKGESRIILSYEIEPGEITSKENEPLQWICPCKIVYSIFTSENQ